MSEADATTKPDPGFTSIYEEHFSRIFRFGFRLLGDPDLAMDLSQEVFLKLHASLGGKPPIGDVPSWLYRTAANLGYDWLRRKRRYSKLAPSDLEAGHQDRDVETDFIRSEESRALRASLDRLEPRDRLLLTLYAEGLRYREIAGAMGLRESSVGTLVARAVQRLSGEFRKGGFR